MRRGRREAVQIRVGLELADIVGSFLRPGLSDSYFCKLQFWSGSVSSFLPFITSSVIFISCDASRAFPDRVHRLHDVNCSAIWLERLTNNVGSLVMVSG